MNIGNPESRIPNPAAGAAFSLLEVMIATAIFFTCTFAILQLVSTTLRNARVLQVREPNAGMLAAELALTNALVEEQMTGNFRESYPGFAWAQDVYQVSSNGLFEADFTIHRRVGRSDVASHMSILLFRPASPPGQIRGTLQ
jgi:Tfp pilus assembly protein PilV